VTDCAGGVGASVFFACNGSRGAAVPSATRIRSQPTEGMIEIQLRQRGAMVPVDKSHRRSPHELRCGFLDMREWANLGQRTSPRRSVRRPLSPHAIHGRAHAMVAQ